MTTPLPDPSAWANATLVGRRDLTERLAIFRVRLDDGDSLLFEPGQFTKLGLPKPPDEAAALPRRNNRLRMTKRAYSLASTPEAGPEAELLITRIDEGRLTPRLWPMEVGDRLWMDDRCDGYFTLEAIPDGKHLLMIATGTGLAPFVSMLRHYKAGGRWRWGRCALLHVVRQPADLAWSDELAALADTHADFVWLPTVTRPGDDAGWPGLTGRPQTLLARPDAEQVLGMPIAADVTAALLCGNPAMIDDVSTGLGDRGFQVIGRGAEGGNVLVERYW